MQTTIQPVSERLKEKWVKETHSKWSKQFDGSWILICDKRKPENRTLLPAPTLDEIMEDLAIEDFEIQYERENPKFEAYIYTWQADRFEWLYTTIRSADALAEMWIKVKGKESTC